eukprot:6036956-Pyramimonas_sp.AAC.1
MVTMMKGFLGCAWALLGSSGAPIGFFSYPYDLFLKPSLSSHGAEPTIQTRGTPRAAPLIYNSAPPRNAGLKSCWVPDLRGPGT